MSLRAVLVILVVAVVMVLCHALPIDDTGADYGNLENFFYLPRLRRDQLAFSGQNAYLRQLLQNLKPKFRRSVPLVPSIIANGLSLRDLSPALVDVTSMIFRAPVVY
nr:unnamed protein product [Haemonchus contortus]